MRLPSKAARRYAKAFFDVAEEAQATEAVRADFASLRTLVAQTPALFTFMRDKRLPHAARLKVWTALLGDRAQPLTLRFVAFLEAKGRQIRAGGAARLWLAALLENLSAARALGCHLHGV